MMENVETAKPENVEEKKKFNYKEIHCNLCNRTYLNNYYYFHKKSQKHMQKEKSIKLRQELLKDDDKPEIINNENDDEPKQESKEIIEDIIKLMSKLKNII